MVIRIYKILLWWWYKVVAGIATKWAVKPVLSIRPRSSAEPLYAQSRADLVICGLFVCHIVS